MDKEDPRELELSLLALLDPPISDIPSEGLLALLPVKIIELRISISQSNNFYLIIPPEQQ